MHPDPQAWLVWSCRERRSTKCRMSAAPGRSDEQWVTPERVALGTFELINPIERSSRVGHGAGTILNEERRRGQPVTGMGDLPRRSIGNRQKELGVNAERALLSRGSNGSTTAIFPSSERPCSVRRAILPKIKTDLRGLRIFCPSSDVATVCPKIVSARALAESNKSRQAMKWPPIRWQ